MGKAILPSQNGWITSRTTENQLTDLNCKIIFPQKIAQLNKILVNADSVYVNVDVPQKTTDYNNKTGTPTWVKLSSLYYPSGNYVTELDITPFVKEVAEWQTLSRVYVLTGKAPFGFYKNNTSYYKQNTNEIIICNETYKTQGNISFPVFLSMIQSACYYSLPHTMNHISSRFDNEVYINSYYIEFDSQVQTTPLNALFRVYYTPLGESVKIRVPKTNPQAREFHIPFSQQQPIVDNVSTGRQMQSLANRTGCEVREVVRTFVDIKDFRNPRDHWYYREKDANGNRTGNVWILTSARLQIYSGHMFRSYEVWSKNWSYRSAYAPLNREFRSWNIPADIVQRNLTWNDYCLISRYDVSKIPRNALLTAAAEKELMRALDGSKGDVPAECNNMWFYTKDAAGNTKGAVMSCSSFGFGNSLIFSGKTKDNLSAGMQRVKSDDRDNNYQFCKDVYYCKDDGTLDEMYVQFGAGISALDVYAYPEYYSNTDGSGSANTPPFSTAISLLYERALKVMKDPAEQLNFTYQLNLLTDDAFLVIGSTLAADNPLVKERDKPKNLKVWKLKNLVPRGAQVMIPQYATEQNPALFSVDRDARTITFNGSANDGVGVCVTDENNNILIALNDERPATFNFVFTHSYKPMYGEESEKPINTHFQYTPDFINVALKDKGDVVDLSVNTCAPVELEFQRDTSLDNGTLKYIRTEQVNSPLNDALAPYVVEYQGNFFEFIGMDSRALLRVKEDGEAMYKHQIALTEPSKLLQGVLIDGFAVSQPEELAERKTLFEVAARLLAVNPLDNSVYTLTTDTTVVNALKGVKSPEFKWNTQTTLWECLLQVGAIIDAIPRLTGDANGDYTVVTFDFINEMGNEAEIIDGQTNVAGENMEESEYNTALSSVLENVRES